MSPQYHLDAALEKLLAALVEHAPYIAGACLALTLLAWLADRLLSAPDATRSAAPAAAAASSFGALAPLVAAGAVHAPMSHATRVLATLPSAARASGASARADAQLPAGVYLVTVSDHHGDPHGMVLSSLCVHDGDPPSVLVCVANDEPGVGHLLAAPTFAVHLLGREQHGLARGGQDDVFEIAGWRRAGGVPVRSDVVACLRCETASVRRHGDHAVVIGTVADVVADGAREPLIRLRGRTDWHLSERALTATRG